MHTAPVTPDQVVAPAPRARVSAREVRLRVAMGRAISVEIDRRRREGPFTCAQIAKLLGERSEGSVRTDLAAISAPRHGRDLTLARLLRFMDVFELPDPVLPSMIGKPAPFVAKLAA